MLTTLLVNVEKSFDNFFNHNVTVYLLDLSGRYKERSMQKP